MLSLIENSHQVLRSIGTKLEERVSLPLGIDASVKHVLLALGATGTITYAISKYIVYRLYLHPLAKIPGPSVSWIPFTRNMWSIITEEAGVPHKRWTTEYGGVVRYHGPWNQPRIVVSDPMLLKQILMTQQYDFIKTPTEAEILGRIVGKGLIVAEGDAHRRQRKMLNPAFSLQAIRDLTPILFVPGVQLCEKWIQEIKDKQTREDEAIAMDVSHGISLAALDEIGLFAFGQEFNAIRYDGTNKINKMSLAYHTIFHPNNRSILQLLGLFFPILQKIPTLQNRLMSKALRTMNEESRNVVQRGIERAKVKTKENHLLALMIRLSDDDSGKGFTPEELRHQCLTFLAAGHETTAATLSWSLWMLAQNQYIQDALRAEITPLFEKINMNDPVFRDDPFQAGFDRANTPSYEEINTLHLLNNVCRETLRLLPVVPVTSRISTKDTVLNGHVIPKGTSLYLPLIVNHHSKEFWGEDAEVFRPSRWDEEAASKVSPYDYCPFLAGGRQCIGYRFALIELKIILSILIMKFQFFEKPGFVCTKQQHITLRPSPNMILLVKPVETNT